MSLFLNNIGHRTSRSVHQVLLLMSMDWFFPYWSVFSLEVSGTEKIRVKDAIKLICSDFMYDASVLWDADFSPNRLDFLSEQLQALFARSDVAIIKEMCEASDDRFPLIDQLSDDIFNFIKKSFPDASYRAILDDIRSVENDQERQTVGWRFRDACLASDTDWDVNVRNFTQDLPEYTSNTAFYLWGSPFVGFTVLVSSIHNKLSQSEKEFLVENLYPEENHITNDILLLYN